MPEIQTYAAFEEDSLICEDDEGRIFCLRHLTVTEHPSDGVKLIAIIMLAAIYYAAAMLVVHSHSTAAMLGYAVAAYLISGAARLVYQCFPTRCVTVAGLNVDTQAVERIKYSGADVKQFIQVLDRIKCAALRSADERYKKNLAAYRAACMR